MRSRMTPVIRLCVVRANTGGCGNDDDDGASLSSLIHDFLGVECSSATHGDHDDGDADAASPPDASGDGEPPDACHASAVADKAKKAAKRITSLLGHGTASDPFRLRLADDIGKGAEEIASLRTNRPLFRRELVSRLREAGYDAAMCETRWQGTPEVAAGSYEYIDVVTSVSGKSTAPGERFIVDMGFATEFVVARPTTDYAKVMESLPRVLVARPKVVQRVVKIAGKAMRRSLKSQGLTVAPWRKKRFMAAKWLGPHRRTTDIGTGPRASAVAAGEVAYRTVGFVLGPPLGPWLSCAL